MYPSIFCYENSSSAASIDNLLDNVTSLLWSSPKDRQPILRPLAVNLGKVNCSQGCLFSRKIIPRPIHLKRMFFPRIKIFSFAESEKKTSPGEGVILENIHP